MRVFGLSATLLEHIDGVGGNHEAPDSGKKGIDLAHTLVGDRSGDEHRGGGGNSRQQAGDWRGQTHRRRVARLAFAQGLNGFAVLLSKGARVTRSHH